MATQTRTRISEVGEAKAPARDERLSSIDAAVGASFIAGGIGSLVLGLAVIGAETNASIKTFLTWNAGAGPLSGKTGIAVIAFLLSWVLLHYGMRSRAISLTRSFTIALVLTGIGLLLTFPPVFLFLAGE